MKNADILIQCLSSSGTVLVLTNDSLSIHTSELDLLSPVFTIELGAHHLHHCQCFVVLPITKIQNNTVLPNLLIASYDCVSSWSTQCSSFSSTMHVLISKIGLDFSKEKGKNSLQMVLSPCQSALALWSSCRISILAIANNGGIAKYASVLHSQEILQVFFISSDQQAPSLLLCRDACGTIHIWSIREKAFLGRVDNMKPSTCSISQGVTSSGNSRGLIATQFKNKQQKGYLAFAVKDVFEFYSIQYSTVGDSTTSKSALSRSCVSMKRVLAINQVHSSMEPLALSFIHDNNRLCILASREDIVIIDCLQKCAIKKVETKSDSLRNELSGPIRAHIAFPFVLLHSNDSKPILERHELESVFAMASDFECDTNHAKHGKKEKNIKMIVEGEKESSMEGRKEIVYKSLIADKENLPSFDELLVDSALVLPTRRRKSNLIKTAGIDTFCSKQVKSSGYGMKGPRMMQGTGPLATAKRERQNKIKKKKLLKDRQQRKRNMLYPIEGNIIDSHQSQHDDNASQCLFPPVASMSFDSLGEFLATAHKDNSLHILRLPFSKYGAASKQVSTSHPYAICETTGAAPFYVPRPSWSYCRRYIALQNKILSLSEGFKSLSISMDLGADSTNGCFYYKDLFTIYSQGSRVFMQRSDISEKDHTNEKTNKIKYSNDTTVNHKRRHEVIFHSGKRSWQRITSIAANNELETNIIGTACSDKSLRIIDAARGEELWSKGNAAGARPAHFIAFPPASSNIPISPDSFNLLLAASTDNGGLCSLWDLRTGKSVRCFSSHVNRTERCFGSFSPCMRYIGIGSEGNSANAFLYDMRATGKVIKIGRSSEHSRFCDNTITDIQFNPLWPQLVTGSLSGRLRWYNAT